VALSTKGTLDKEGKDNLKQVKKMAANRKDQKIMEDMCIRFYTDHCGCKHSTAFRQSGVIEEMDLCEPHRLYELQLEPITERAIHKIASISKPDDDQIAAIVKWARREMEAIPKPAI